MMTEREKCEFIRNELDKLGFRHQDGGLNTKRERAQIFFEEFKNHLLEALPLGTIGLAYLADKILDFYRDERRVPFLPRGALLELLMCAGLTRSTVSELVYLSPCVSLVVAPNF